MDTNFDPTWAVEITYEVPLGFLPPSIPLVFNGCSNFYGPKGTGSPGQPNTALQFLSEQRLTLDVGRMLGQRPGFYSVYGGFRYWKNKFGIDSGNPANAGLYPGVIESTWITGVTVEF